MAIFCTCTQPRLHWNLWMKFTTIALRFDSFRRRCCKLYQNVGRSSLIDRREKHCLLFVYMVVLQCSFLFLNFVVICCCSCIFSFRAKLLFTCCYLTFCPFIVVFFLCFHSYQTCLLAIGFSWNLFITITAVSSHVDYLCSPYVRWPRAQRTATEENACK